MIVSNKGYLKIKDLKELKYFSIYETSKNTHILLIGKSSDKVCLHFPKKDRLPFKITEGKKICIAKKVFDSEINSIDTIDLSKWNNGNQIMSYEEFSCW